MGKCSNDIYWNFSRHYMKNSIKETEGNAHSAHLQKNKTTTKKMMYLNKCDSLQYILLQFLGFVLYVHTS